MTYRFKTIGLIGKPRNREAIITHISIYQWLKTQGIKVLIDDRLKDHEQFPESSFEDLVSIGEKADLAIVIGGDGNMLSAARVLARFDICVIGVNRGNLGFLADLDPEEFKETLGAVLQGEYIEDPRFLLETEIHRHGEIKSRNAALNEVVLHAGQVAHMIEFELYIDGSFAFSQRSDGLIIATPTGSTAYNLSAGGPILSPSIEAISLVPMFPHTLSSRPLVVDAKRYIKFIVPQKNNNSLEVSCDSQVTLTAAPGDEIHIYRGSLRLQLIHPKQYSYYTTLRTKLGWSSKLF